MDIYSGTDFAYAAHPIDTLTEIARALNVGIGEVTCTALRDERTLYHACLSAISTKLYFDDFNEKSRGTAIHAIANDLYDKAEPLFTAAMVLNNADIKATNETIRQHVARIEKSIPPGPLNREAYTKMWGLDNYPESWQRRAFDTYETIKTRVDSGEYSLPEDQTIASLTTLWCQINYRYKTIRHLARNYIDGIIADIDPEQKRLSFQPATEHRTEIFTGGMGCGKSTLTHLWLGQLSADEKGGFFIQDADYLKLPLGLTALRDGVIKQYTGTEVHNESTAVLREIGRKINFLAKTGEKVPHVVMNSIYVSEYRLTEALAGGGNVGIHHISIDPEEAWASVEMRARAIGRSADKNRVVESCQRSSENIMDLMRFAGSNICMYIYERQGTDLHRLATIDLYERAIHIHDEEGLKRMVTRGGRDYESAAWRENLTVIFDNEPQPQSEVPDSHARRNGWLTTVCALR